MIARRVFASISVVHRRAAMGPCVAMRSGASAAADVAILIRRVIATAIIQLLCALAVVTATMAPATAATAAGVAGVVTARVGIVGVVTAAAAIAAAAIATVKSTGHDVLDDDD